MRRPPVLKPDIRLDFKNYEDIKKRAPPLNLRRGPASSITLSEALHLLYRILFSAIFFVFPLSFQPRVLSFFKKRLRR